MLQEEPVSLQWLRWAQQIQAIAQTGLAYTEGPYDRERYHQLRAIAAEMLAAYGGSDPTQVLDLLSQETGYATPKVDVRGVVFRDDTILLVKEREDGRWTLPGGWADVGETPAEATVREVQEEAGYPTRAVKLLAAYDRDRQGHTPPLIHAVYKLFFRCELLDDSVDPQPNLEVEDVGFFAADRIPDLSLGRVTPQQLARWFEHYRQPDLPTDFD